MNYHLKMRRIKYLFLLIFALTLPLETWASNVSTETQQTKKRKSTSKKVASKKNANSTAKATETSTPTPAKKKARTPVVRGNEILRLKSKKDSESKLYGYENSGDKYYWWAEAHYMGQGKDQLNQGMETQWVIAPQYTRVSKEFSEGLAAVELKGKVGFIDRSNRFIIPPVFEQQDDLDGFHYGLAAVKKDGKYGFINKKGEFVIPPTFDGAENFGDDYLAVIKVGKKFGCIDLKGDTVVPCDYIAKEMMKNVPVKNKPYREAKNRAKERWEQGYYASVMDPIQKVSEEVNRNIENPNFTEKPGIAAPDGAVSVGDGFYVVTANNGKQGAFDSYGRQIIPAIHENVTYDLTQRLFIVSTKAPGFRFSATGLANTGGGWIIPPVFDKIGAFSATGIAPVAIGDVTGEVNVLGLVNESFLESLLMESSKEKGTFYTQRLIGVLPTCAPAHNNMGIYYAAEQDNLRDAIHHFTVAHNLAPDVEDFKNNMKAAKSTRNNRRWNRVMTGLSIAGAVLTLGSMTYAAAKGVTMDSSSFSSGGSALATSSGGSSYSGGSSSSGNGKCKRCQGSGTCSPKSGTSRKNACHGSGLCGHCNGTGWLAAGGDRADCPQCDRGKCKTCNGSGKCPDCKGTGKG